MVPHMEHQHAHSGCEQMKQQLVHQPQLVVRLVTSLAGRHTNRQTVSLCFTSTCVTIHISVSKSSLLIWTALVHTGGLNEPTEATFLHVRSHNDPVSATVMQTQ